ncbi:MAG: DUF362 domain-containing protein [Spirochaetaceae bacterium]|nr:MAG: DUF362 domain-containing protein [Spirochaetaceae bacterium]
MVEMEKPDFLFILNNSLSYPEPPFNPDKPYPEARFAFPDLDPGNKVYEAVRNLLEKSGLDRENQGSPAWNPFRGLVKDGETIVIKPNLVMHEPPDAGGKHCMTTHGSIIRPLLDFIYLLQCQENIKVNVIIADVPIQGASFAAIMEETGIRALADYYTCHFDLSLACLDLRRQIARIDSSGFLTTTEAPGDPAGYEHVTLPESFLDDISSKSKWLCPGYGDVNPVAKQAWRNQTMKHYYVIPRSILKARLFINLPKIKTHKKAGVTLAMKNLIGIVGDKSWLPHFQRGSRKQGGDEFDDDQFLLKILTSNAERLLQSRSRLLWKITRFINRKFIKRIFRKDLRKRATSDTAALPSKAGRHNFFLNGDWYGNDTIWRPILDLNRLLWTTDNRGVLTGKQQRSYICIGEGIIAGERNGPLEPAARRTGLLTLGCNPVIHDICCSRLMGFDWRKIPQLREAKRLKDTFSFNGDTGKLKITGTALGNHGTSGLVSVPFDEMPRLDMQPSDGWKDHIELEKE